MAEISMNFIIVAVLGIIVMVASILLYTQGRKQFSSTTSVTEATQYCTSLCMQIQQKIVGDASEEKRIYCGCEDDYKIKVKLANDREAQLHSCAEITTCTIQEGLSTTNLDETYCKNYCNNNC